MSRGMPTLATIAATAPLIGIFGTVLGMLNSFRSVGGSRTTILAAMTGWISEAMIPTLLGLIVGVPAFWCYQYLTSQMEVFDMEMENATSDLLNRLIVYLARFPLPVPKARRPQAALSGGEVVAPCPAFTIKRIWRNGFAELVWPMLESEADTESALQRGTTVAFGYAILGWLTCAMYHRPFAAAVIFGFYMVAGVGLAEGSYFAAVGIAAYAGIACLASAVTFGMSFGACCLAISPLFLVGWMKARFHAAAKPRRLWSRPRILTPIGVSLFGGCAVLAILFDTVFSLDLMGADSSMAPSLQSGDAVVSVAAPLMGKIRRGDLVLLHHGELGASMRVVGLAGDRIQVVSGKLIRNGSVAVEPYVKRPYTSISGDFPSPSADLPEALRWRRDNIFQRDLKDDRDFTVPKNSYFVLNDNRNEMHDSRIFGELHQYDIAGRPILAYGMRGAAWTWPRWVH
jgi:signal peptidase I